MKYLLLIIYATCISCKAQNETKKMNKEAIDIISPAIPFILERESIFAEMPDSLGGNRTDGVAVLSVYIDSVEQIRGFKILKLKIDQKKTGNILSFTNNEMKKESTMKKDYPIDVQKYYDFIKKYIQSISFKRDRNVPLEKSNELTFMVKFR